MLLRPGLAAEDGGTGRSEYIGVEPDRRRNAPGLVPGGAQQAALQGQRFAPKSRPVDQAQLWPWLGDAGERRNCLPLQVLLVGGEQRGRPREGRPCARKVPLDLRQQEVPQRVPAQGRVIVGWIVERGEAMLRAIGQDRRPADRQQRSPDGEARSSASRAERVEQITRAPHRRHADQTSQTGTAQQMQEQRLGLVVGVLGQGQNTRPDANGLVGEAAVTPCARDLLDIRRRRAIERHRARDEGDVARGAPVPYLLRFGGRIGAQPMIDVQRHERGAALLTPAPEQMQEREGIRATGDADEDRRGEFDRGEHVRGGADDGEEIGGRHVCSLTLSGPSPPTRATERHTVVAVAPGGRLGTDSSHGSE